MSLIKYNSNGYRPTTFNQFVDRFFNDDVFDNLNVESFYPKVDIAETKDAFEIQLHVPGINKKDIQIEINDDRLKVFGERKMETEKTTINYRSVESQFGSFTRSFYLPENVNSDKIEASYKDGILNVIVPKDEKKELKKTIEIR